MTATTTTSIWDEIDAVDKAATRVQGGARPSPQPADIWDEIDAVAAEPAAPTPEADPYLREQHEKWAQQAGKPLTGPTEPIPPTPGGPAARRRGERAAGRAVQEKRKVMPEPWSPEDWWAGGRGPGIANIPSEEQLASHREWLKDKATLEAAKAKSVPEMMEDEAYEAGVPAEEYRKQNPEAEQWAYWKLQGPVDHEEYVNKFIKWDEKIPIAGGIIGANRTERLLNSVEYLKKLDAGREGWLAERAVVRPKNDPIRKEREKWIGGKSDTRHFRHDIGLHGTYGHRMVEPNILLRQHMGEEVYQRLWGSGLQSDPWLTKQSQLHADTVAAYLTSRAELSARGTTLMSDVLEGTSELPSYMAEFALGSGMAKVGSAAARKGVQGVLQKIGLRTTRKGLAGALVRGGGKLVEHGVGWAVGAAAHVPGMSARMRKNMLERLVPRQMSLSDKGKLIVQTAGDKPLTAFVLAAADTLIQAMAETSGGVVTAGAKKLFPKTTQGLAQALRSGGITPKVLRSLQTMGYHGPGPELFEEQLEKIMKAGFNVRAPGEDTESMTRLEWLAQQFGERQLLTEAIVVTVPMVAGAAVSAAVRPAKGKPAAPAPAAVEPQPTEPQPEPAAPVTAEQKAATEARAKAKGEAKQATRARAREAMEKALSRAETPQVARALAEALAEEEAPTAQAPPKAEAPEAKPAAKPPAPEVREEEAPAGPKDVQRVTARRREAPAPAAEAKGPRFELGTIEAMEQGKTVTLPDGRTATVRSTLTTTVEVKGKGKRSVTKVRLNVQDGTVIEATGGENPTSRVVSGPTPAKEAPAAPQAREVAPQPTKPPAEAPSPAKAEGKQAKPLPMESRPLPKGSKSLGKQPWKMSAAEWEAAREAIRPGVQSDLTRRSASEAEGNIGTLVDLLGGVHDEARAKLKAATEGDIEMSPEEASELLEQINTRVSHRDVVEAAIARGDISSHPDYPALAKLPAEKPAKPAKAEAKPEKPPAKPAPTKPKVDKRPPSRERLRQQAVDTDRWSTEEVDASMTLLDAVAETLVRDGKIDSADDLYGRLSITTEVPTAEATAQTAKGATQFLDDGTAVIHAMEGADISTLAHEAAHFFRRVAAEHYAHDLQMLEDWAGVVNNNWTNPAEEKFARAFERYLRTGKAPTSALKRVFHRFKEWLKRIYSKLRGSAIDVKISPEVEALFGKLLGAKETLAEIAETRQLKKLAPRAKKELTALRGEILSWYRQEVRDPVEDVQVGAAGWLDPETVAEGQYAVEPTGDFAKRFPGEIRDILKDEVIAAGKKPTPAVIRAQAEKYNLRENIPGGLAEDYIASIGGAAVYFQRARTRQTKESDLFDQALQEMDEFAKATYNDDMAYKIARYRHLQDAGADLLLDEARTGKKLTITPEVGEPPPLSKDVATEAEETLKQYNLLGEEIVKPLTRGKTGELIGKGEVVETAVGEVEITDELRQEAVKYFLALPKKAKADAKVFYVELREQYGTGVADLFNDYTNPMPEIREALLRAEKGGSLFGQEAKAPPGPDVLFQAQEAGIPAKTQRALNNVAITTAETLAKQRALTFARWERKVTAKVRSLAPDLADRYREQLDTVWHAIKQGTLEHMEDAQLPYGTREKMQDFFTVQKVLARRIAKTGRQRAVAAAEKISKPTPAAAIKKAVKGQQDAGKEAQALLNAVLGREERGARRAWLESARAVVEQHKDLAEFARKTLARAELTPAQVERLAQLVTRGRTPSETRRVIEAIQELAAQAHAHATLARTKDLAALLKKYSKQTDFGLAREGKTLVEGLKPRAPLSAIARHFAAASRQLESLGRPLSKESAVRHIQASIAEAIAESGDVELNRADPGVLNDILNAAHELIFQEGRHNDLVAAEKGAKYDEALAETLTQIETLHKPQPEHPGWARRLYEGIIRPAVNLGASLDTTVYHLFGQGNKVAEVLHDRLVTGERKAIRLSRERREYFGGVMLAAKGFRKAMKQSVTVTLGGQQVKMKVKHLATILGNMRDPDTMDSMDTIDGRKFKLSNRRGFTYRVMASDMPAIESAIPDVVKRYLDAFMGWRNGRQAEEIDATAERILGRKMSRPGAFPRKIDQNEIPFEPNALMRDYRTRTRVEHLGRWKQREGGAKTLIIEPLDLIVERDARQAVIYAAKAPAIQDALRLIRDPAFRDAAEKRLPGAQRTMRYLEDAVMDYQGLGEPSPRQDRIVKGALSRFYTYALGLKPHIWLGQVASIISAQTNMRLKYFTLNPANIVRARREMLAEVPELAERAAASGISFIAPVEVAEAHPAASDQPLLVRGIDLVSSRPIRGMDTLTISAIYHAAKAEGVAEKGLSGQALIDYAGTRTLDIVDRTQPTWDALTSSNLSLWARKNPWAKVLLSVAFTAQVHKNYNGVLRAVVAGRRGDISKKEAARQIILFTAAQATTLVLMRQFVFMAFGVAGDLARALFGIDDEEDYERDLWTKLQARVRDHVERIPGRSMERVFGNIPWIDMSRDLFGGGPLQTRTQEEITRAVKDGYGAMTAEEKDDAWAKAGKFTKGLIRAGGALAGLPTEGPMMYWRVLTQAAPGGVYAKDVFRAASSQFDDIKDKAKIDTVLTTLKRSGITLSQAQDLVGKFAKEDYERRTETYEKEQAKFKAKKRAKEPKKPSELQEDTIQGYKDRLEARWKGQTYTKPSPVSGRTIPRPGSTRSGGSRTR